MGGCQGVGSSISFTVAHRTTPQLMGQPHFYVFAIKIARRQKGMQHRLLLL